MNKIKLSQAQAARMARLVRKLRKDVNLTQLELSQAVTGFDVSHCFISRIERAKLTKVPKERIEAMAQSLFVEPDYLIGNVYSVLDSMSPKQIENVFSVARKLSNGQLTMAQISQLAA